MESPHGLLLVALIIASSTIIHLVQAQDQKGFINLDCGLPENELSPYMDPDSGLPYSSDSAFIQSGKIGRIEKSLEESFVEMEWTLRYFPDGMRNCYSLNITKGTNYLIKATFLYGNYDGLDIRPKFDLHIGPNLWNSIDLNEEDDTVEEIMHTPRNIKATYGLKKSTWQGDPCVPKQFLWDGLICNIVDNSTPPIITSLNLSSSGLTGTIADGIQNLTYLEKLDLSNNSLVGAVPEYLAIMRFLSFINLSKNKINGSIPQVLLDRLKKGLKIILDGDDEKPSLSGSLAPKKKFPVLLIIAVVASLVVIVLVLIFVSKRKRANSHVEDSSIETKRKKFSYLEVLEMTKNLERPLGKGAFGVVYYGEVNSSQVAVKLLSKSSAQGYKEFKAEVDLLLRVHHINLVSLVGYCDERDELALIYEYMPNLDLKHHLSGKDGVSVLSWSIRIHIAIDSALGLEYLHNGCRPPMVHRDIKSTNILLDEHFSAKLADFGLSRSSQHREESNVSTAVAGTPGYLDPEYYRTGRLAKTNDVYSFGIVLLEIMTNLRVTDQNFEKSHITEWTASMINGGDITKIMDPNLNGDYNSPSVWRALELAMLCANPSSENRPIMSQVVVELKECLNCENKMRSNNQDKESQSSLEVSISVNTQAVPSAR